MDFHGYVSLAILLYVFMQLQQAVTVPSSITVILGLLILVHEGRFYFLRHKVSKLTTPEPTACTRCLTFDAYKVRSEADIAKHVEKENTLEARIWNKDINYETISCELIKSQNEANGLKVVINDLKNRNNQQCNCPLIGTSPRVDIINKLERQVKELKATIKTLEPFKDQFETTQAKFDEETQAWNFEVDTLKDAIANGNIISLDPVTNEIIFGDRPESVKQVPAEQDPVQQTSVAQAPAQQDTVHQTRAAQAQAQQGPVQQGPVQQTPAQQAPVTQAPAQQAQVDSMDEDTLGSCAEPEEDDVEMAGAEPFNTSPFNTSGFGSNNHAGFPVPAPIVSWPGTGFGPSNNSNGSLNGWASTMRFGAGSNNGSGSTNGFGSENNSKWSNGFGNTNNSGSSKDDSFTNMGFGKFVPPVDSFGSSNSSGSSSGTPSAFGSSTGNGIGGFGSSSSSNGFASTSTSGINCTRAPTAPASSTSFGADSFRSSSNTSSRCGTWASSFGRPSSSTSSGFGTPSSSTSNSGFRASSTSASSTFGSTTPSPTSSTSVNFSATTFATYGSKPSTPTITSIFAASSSSSKGKSSLITDISVTCESPYGTAPITITVPTTANLTKLTNLYKSQAGLSPYQRLTLKWDTELQWQQLKDMDVAIGLHPEIVGVDKMHTLRVRFQSKQ